MKGEAARLFVWDVPVRVRIGNGLRETIVGPLEALTYLATRWPTERGDRYDEAQAICRTALEGYASLEAARDAFIAAAIFARIMD